MVPVLTSGLLGFLKVMPPRKPVDVRAGLDAFTGKDTHQGVFVGICDFIRIKINRDKLLNH